MDIYTSQIDALFIDSSLVFINVNSPKQFVLSE